MLMDECSGFWEEPCASSGVFWASCAVVMLCGLGTMVWLKIVFTRHEVTRALPIEYGMLNTVAVLAGVVFYREYEYMEEWQLAACFSGLSIVLVGVGISAMTSLPCCPSRMTSVAPSPVQPQEYCKPASIGDVEA